MFSKSFFRDFDDDPFFSMHRDRMHGMDNMFGDRRPGGGSDPWLAITEGGRDDRHQRQHDRSTSHDLQPAARHRRGGDSEMMPSNRAMDPFSFMNSMMSGMHSMMGNVSKQMEDVRNDPNAHCYMQSSVLSYSNTGQGKPSIYQATTATRQAPGGVRETRKAVRDSAAGVEKMAVGHHLNDRGHVITRQRDTRTGNIDENQDFLNLDEAEAPRFDEEWRNVASRYTGRRDQAAIGHRSRATNDGYDRDANSEPTYSRRHPANKHKAVERGRRVEKAY